MSLSKRNKWVLAILIIGIVIAYAGYRYAYKPHKTIESLAIDFSGNSDSFLIKIKEDASVWQNKVVVLSGTITNSDGKGITLSNQIYCQFREDVDVTSIQNKQEIKIKGRVIGYDDLLEELKLDQCIIQQ